MVMISQYELGVTNNIIMVMISQYELCVTKT